MFVSELMKYETASVAPGTTLADAARIMITQHISGLPVVEDERLVGVITEGDLMCRIEIGTDEKKRSWIKTFFLPGSVAGDYVKRLPVVWSDKLVGVISRSDLLCSLARHLVQTNDPFSEVDIRRHILATLDSENWAPKTGITIKVADGVVDLDGVVISDNQRRAIRVIAETTPGVNQVRDHLVFVDPTSGISIPVA
jgi:CBS domain-containing protein